MVRCSCCYQAAVVLRLLFRTVWACGWKLQGLRPVWGALGNHGLVDGKVSVGRGHRPGCGLQRPQRQRYAPKAKLPTYHLMTLSAEGVDQGVRTALRASTAARRSRRRHANTRQHQRQDALTYATCAWCERRAPVVFRPHGSGCLNVWAPGENEVNLLMTEGCGGTQRRRTQHVVRKGRGT